MKLEVRIADLPRNFIQIIMKGVTSGSAKSRRLTLFLETDAGDVTMSSVSEKCHSKHL